MKKIIKAALTSALEHCIPQLAHEGFHGLKTYDHPRAATVERNMWEFAVDNSRCGGCRVLLYLEHEGIIYIDDLGDLKVIK